MTRLLVLGVANGRYYVNLQDNYRRPGSNHVRISHPRGHEPAWFNIYENARVFFLVLNVSYPGCVCLDCELNPPRWNGLPYGSAFVNSDAHVAP